MKKLFTLVVLMCLLGVNRVWAGDDFYFFSLDGTNIAHNFVKERANENEVAYVDCFFRYRNNGGQIISNNLYKKFKFKVQIIGELQMTDGSAFTYDGQERTDITQAFQIRFKGRGGAIIVWADGNHGDVIGWQTYFVITAPYIGNQVWDFFTNANLNIRQESLPHWKESTKFNGHPERPLKVVDTEFDKSNWAKNDSHDVIAGTNARYIPETAGLVFDVPTDKFGINDNTKINSETGNPYKIKNYVVLGGYGTLTIPHVKSGSFVKIWMDAMDSGAFGAKYSAQNLRDLDNTPIVNNFSFTGVTDYDMLSGCMIFKVDGNEGEYKNVSLKLQDEGYTDIYRIEITDTYSTDMVLFQCQDMGDPGWKTGGVVVYNNEYAHIVHNGVNKQERYYNGTPSYAVLQRAKTCEFKVEKTGTVDYSAIVEEAVNTHGSNTTRYNYLHLEDISGTGNIKITQKEKFGDYVLNKKETWIAVGEYTKQSYPYTWDFTAYNVDRPSFDLLDWLVWSSRPDLDNENYGYWVNNNNVLYSLETHVPVTVSNNSDNQPWMKEKVDKPLFAQGSQLTGGTTAINETKGLRVKQLAGTFEDGSEKYATGAEYDGEIQIDGQALIYTPKVSGDKLQMTIPEVGNNMYVFVDASTAPTVTGASSSSAFSQNSGVYEYKGTGSDIELTFDNATRIKAIGVTNIIKPVNQYGYATESRERIIDHTYTGKFTSNDVNAYLMKDYDGTKVTMVETDVIPENTGVVMYKSGTSTGFNAPLFVNACNVGPDDTTGNLLKPNVTSSTLNMKDGDYTNFILTDISYHIKHMDDVSTVWSGEDKIGFYRVGKAGTLGANKSYLQLPTSDLNTTVGAKGLVLIWDGFGLEEPSGITTSLDQVGADSYAEGEKDIYNLHGQKLDNVSGRKGIFIVNGKKVIVK